MTSVICSAHRDLFSQDSHAAQHAFEQLNQLLQMVRRKHVEAPILAIHHARLEIVQILLLASQPCAFEMLRQVLRDLAQPQPTIDPHAIHYFLDMIRDALSDCAFFSHGLRDEAHQVLSSLALLHDLPNEVICRALTHISAPCTHVC